MLLNVYVRNCAFEIDDARRFRLPAIKYQLLLTQPKVNHAARHFHKQYRAVKYERNAFICLCFCFVVASIRSNVETLITNALCFTSQKIIYFVTLLIDSIQKILFYFFEYIKNCVAGGKCTAITLQQCSMKQHAKGPQRNIARVKKHFVSFSQFVILLSTVNYGYLLFIKFCLIISRFSYFPSPPPPPHWKTGFQLENFPGSYLFYFKLLFYFGANYERIRINHHFSRENQKINVLVN